MKIGAFIDASNLNLSAIQHLGYGIDYNQLYKLCSLGSEKMVKALVYAVNMGGGFDQWIEVVSNCGFTVRRKEPHVRADGSRKADCDIMLTIGVVRYLPRVDWVVIGSGDGDFEPLIEFVHKCGKKVRVIAVPEGTHSAMRKQADEYVPITKEHLFVPPHYVRRARESGRLRKENE